MVSHLSTGGRTAASVVTDRQTYRMTTITLMHVHIVKSNFYLYSEISTRVEQAVNSFLQPSLFHDYRSNSALSTFLVLSSI